jgi:hypothetical protein
MILALTFTELLQGSLLWFIGFLIFALGCPRL